jgi:hypothetical protein
MTRRISDWGGNIMAFVVVMVVNGMANGVPLGGQTTGQISDKYPSLFTPAGYVFSIWSVIYLGLLTFVVWQSLPSQRENQSLAGISIPFQASCAFNAAWIFAWHYDLLVLSLVFMFGILMSLVQVYRNLNIGLSAAPLTERLIVHLPFSIYTGWITVATIANISALQINQGWDDFWIDAPTWTVFKIALAGSVAASVLFRRRDIAFVLVAVWASAGIAVKQAASPLVGGAATVIAMLGLLLIGLEFWSRSRS